MENKFKVGDWVKENYYGRIGFITKIKPEDQKCYVQIVRNSNGSKPVTDSSGYFRYHNLEILQPEIHQEDLHSLQHVAVLWKDEQWFQELAGRKGE